MKAEEHDYLAVILVGGGSVYGRAANRERAIANAIKIYKSDIGEILEIKRGDEVVVNVIDVAPHDEIDWDYTGFYVGQMKIDRPVEIVRRSI
jgi:hypothetical protein